jgi:RNA polymerase sigma factor (sigma-70 family)
MTLNATHLLEHLRRLTTPAALASAGDGPLLARFAGGGDEAAFATLVARHGPMVLGVCRRLLGDAHAAEDAFQATFLVLARKAGAVRHGASLAAWLHGVAARVAGNARRAERRRPARQSPAAMLELPDHRPDPPAELAVREAMAALEEEIQRLPAAYRIPVALCCLEGLSLDEAARRLGWTAGSVKGRLERGRTRLRQRLLGRGLALATVLEAARGSCRAGLPICLVPRTARAAIAFARPPHPTTPVSASTLRLVEQTLKGEMMLRRKLTLAAALLLGLTTLAAGALGVVAGQAGPGKEAGAERPPLELTLDLSDGSRVVGRSGTLKELLLHASFGDVRIPANQVAALQFKDDRGSVVVRFHNGDQLTGTIDLKTLGDLKVATALGETTVPLSLVKTCKIEPAPGPAKVTARASSTGEATDPNDAFKPAGQASRWNSGGYAPGWIEADLGAPRKLDRITLVVSQLPAGLTVHEVWVSNEPIGEERGKARLVHTFRGETDQLQELKHTFGPDVVGRYVQIRTTESPSWVGWQWIDLQVR